jgi:hypothetical protein
MESDGLFQEIVELVYLGVLGFVFCFGVASGLFGFPWLRFCPCFRGSVTCVACPLFLCFVSWLCLYWLLFCLLRFLVPFFLYPCFYRLFSSHHHTVLVFR